MKFQECEMTEQTTVTTDANMLAIAVRCLDPQLVPIDINGSDRAASSQRSLVPD